MYDKILKFFLLCLRHKNPCLHGSNNNKQSLEDKIFDEFTTTTLALVVLRQDNAIDRINRHPVVVC